MWDGINGFGLINWRKQKCFNLKTFFNIMSCHKVGIKTQDVLRILA